MSKLDFHEAIQNLIKPYIQTCTQNLIKYNIQASHQDATVRFKNLTKLNIQEAVQIAMEDRKKRQINSMSKLIKTYSKDMKT